jgi:hypothetical protein
VIDSKYRKPSKQHICFLYNSAFFLTYLRTTKAGREMNHPTREFEPPGSHSYYPVSLVIHQSMISSTFVLGEACEDVFVCQRIPPQDLICYPSVIIPQIKLETDMWRSESRSSYFSFIIYEWVNLGVIFSPELLFLQVSKQLVFKFLVEFWLIF